MEARNVYTFVELAHALKTVLPNYTKGRVGHSCCIPRYRKYRLSTDIYVARIFPSALYSRGRERIGDATTMSNRKKIRRKLRRQERGKERKEKKKKRRKIETQKNGWINRGEDNEERTVIDCASTVCADVGGRISKHVEFIELPYRLNEIYRVDVAIISRRNGQSVYLEWNELIE